jgi:circadian clock protein KaiC
VNARAFRARSAGAAFAKTGAVGRSEGKSALNGTKKIISTGVPTLDHLLGGGIPARQAVVVTGDPGTGKTILCSQIAFAHAARGENVVVATVASEPHDKLLDELREFSFFDPERVGKEIFVLSAYPWVKKGPKEAKDILLKTLRDRKAKLLFVDGMRSLRDLWADEAKLRDFLYELNVGVSQHDAIALFTTEYSTEKLMEYPEATTVDGIVGLSTVRAGGRVLRRARVVKLRGRAHLTSEHLMHITADGIRIVPRLEETTQPERAYEPTLARAEFDLPELDEILRGGLPAKSTTMLAGSTGVGKTLLSLRFCAAGARRGEPALLVSYSEPVPRLVARAQRIGLEVQPLLDAGTLHVEYRTTVNTEGDDLVNEILDRVQETGAKRLVVDGISDIEHGILDHERVRTLLSALIIELRNRGVTAVFVKEVAKIAGPDLDFSDSPISVTAENVIFLRHVELRGRLRRILSILKMRESGYDPHVREFAIESNGIRVLDPLRESEGLLTGLPRAIFPPDAGGAA